MLLALFLFQWPIKPYPDVWWHFPGTCTFTNSAFHLVQEGTLLANEPPLALLWSRVELLCLSPCVQLHSSGMFFMLKAVLSKTHLFFFQRVEGRRGEGERTKCICNKGSGVFGPQTTDHILIPVAETKLWNLEKIVSVLFYGTQITQPVVVENIILTLVEMVRETLQDCCRRCQDYCNRREWLGSTWNAPKMLGIYSQWAELGEGMCHWVESY